MNIDDIFNTLNRYQVKFILIGGVNFLLRHKPVLTFDTDVWIRDDLANLQRCEEALMELDAEWGASDDVWGPVSKLRPNWLSHQSMFCLITRAGALDIFRRVEGLPDWDACVERATACTTKDGAKYISLSDADMLACQLALPEAQRKLDRIRDLELKMRA